MSRGVLPDRAVTVVQAEWHGTQALTLTYRDDAGQGRPRAALPRERGRARDRGGGPRLELRRRRPALPPRLRGAADPARAPVRPVPRGAHVEPRSAAAPDPGRLRGDAAAPAAALPARRRPRRRQDDHGRAADQGADRPRRPQALPDRAAREPRRAVAGRARAEARARVRDHHARRRSRRRAAATRSRRRTSSSPASTSSRATTTAGEARADRLGSDRRRRGAQDVGALLRAAR